MKLEQLANVYVQSIYRFLRDKKMLGLYYNRHLEAIKRGNANSNTKLMEALKMNIIRDDRIYPDIIRIMFGQIYTKDLSDSIDISYAFETYNIRKLGYKIPNDK